MKTRSKNTCGFLVDRLNFQTKSVVGGEDLGYLEISFQGPGFKPLG